MSKTKEDREFEAADEDGFVPRKETEPAPPKRPRLNIYCTIDEQCEVWKAIHLRNARDDTDNNSGACLADICRTWREAENQRIRAAHNPKEQP